MKTYSVISFFFQPHNIDTPAYKTFLEEYNSSNRDYNLASLFIEEYDKKYSNDYFTIVTPNMILTNALKYRIICTYLQDYSVFDYTVENTTIDNIPAIGLQCNQDQKFYHFYFFIDKDIMQQALGNWFNKCNHSYKYRAERLSVFNKRPILLTDFLPLYDIASLQLEP